MSSMLEQAIVDAKALKESAIKNAEAMVIEKYSDQIKEAVNSLLEQDELGLEDDPLAGEGDLAGGEATPETNPVLNQVPTAMEEDLPADSGGGDVTDSTTLTLDLPDLLQKMEEIEKEEGIDAVDALDGEKESHEELAQDMAPAVDSAPESASTMMEQVEEEDITDALVDEILERLRVDIDPQPRGWAGTPRKHMEELADQALAREADDEVKEENEALRARVAELEESLSKTTDQNQTLVEERDKFRDAILVLKEKIDIVNVSNAKLLYINKALENSSLNERQKKKLVEAISKAETTKEAKVIYETLQSTVGSTDRRSMPKSLSEAVSRSNSSLLINSQRNKENTTSDAFSERLQRLAGLKK